LGRKKKPIEMLYLELIKKVQIFSFFTPEISLQVQVDFKKNKWRHYIVFYCWRQKYSKRQD